MHEPPQRPTTAEVLAAVRGTWDGGVDRVEHLPVGFGAHHWRAWSGAQPRLFVTYDTLGPRHDAASLEAAYATAARLRADGLGFVLAPLPTPAGAHTSPVADGALSVTPWVDGTSGDGPLTGSEDARRTAAMLHDLHAVPRRRGVPGWSPLVGDGLADALADLTRAPWHSGPYGEPARAAVRARLTAVAGWTARYHHLAGVARSRRWVVTHGEPHTRNQMRTAVGHYLVDWESVKVAPAERDTRLLVAAGHGDLVHADEAMLELFDLEWRLDEVSQYASWFAAAHAGGEDDAVAFAGLLGELQR